MTGFSGPLPPRQFNLAEYVIARSAAEQPQKVALLVVHDVDAPGETETWTYAQLDLAVRKIAAALAARGLQRGDRVLIRLDNTSAYALLFFGAIAAGFVPIPASSQLTDAEAAFVLENSGARCVVLADDAAMPVAVGVGVLHARDIDGMIAASDASAAARYAETEADEPA